MNNMRKTRSNSYAPINSEKLAKQMQVIEDCWSTYLSEITALQSNNTQLKVPQYSVDIVALREIVERVYQRKDYFIRFHSGMLMSEYKEIGLYMFWISKFKPFRILDLNFNKHTSFRANEDFAMYFMLSALKNLANKLGLKYNSDNISGNLYGEILYSLCFRDLSKESLGIIVELVANIVISDLPTKT